MNIKVINIQPQHEVILGFLFPDYVITDSLAVTRNFITHRDVKSRVEREALDIHYDNGIFISNQIFDEIWDEDKIKQECIEFSRKRFKNRKKTINTTKETFIEDCVKFIFDIPSLEDDNSILELFESFGSAKFPVNYFKLLETVDYQQVVASLITFISKINKESSNIYYKKKGILLEDKINTNLEQSIDNYNLSVKDGYGVTECYLFCSLFK